MIGDYNWGLKTRGNLNLMAKIYFTYQAIKAKRNSQNKHAATFVYREGDLNIPDSKSVNQTIEFLKDTHQEFLINHCYRTYLFGNVIGQNERLKFDKELFAIASLLHDLGLTKNHQFKGPDCKCFAIEGATEAGTFLEKQNVEKDKIKRVQDAISLHLNIKVPTNLPEAYLLNRGAAVDVIGQNIKRFSANFIGKTITQYPRLNFKSEIHPLLKQQCQERPQSRIAFLYQHRFSRLIKNAAFEE
ncbi:MAG: HD domain-containing protein [Cyclobacteriaceae bacterium]|jgi:hypothetical protein